MSLLETTTAPDARAEPSLDLAQVRPLGPGDAVEVQNRFDGAWCRGFEIVEVLSGVGVRRYRIRRLSDGSVLPRLFVEAEVGPTR